MYMHVLSNYIVINNFYTLSMFKQYTIIHSPFCGVVMMNIAIYSLVRTPRKWLIAVNVHKQLVEIRLINFGVEGFLISYMLHKVRISINM